MPQTPRVWPKSSKCFSMLSPVATSKTPPSPTTVLTATLAVSEKPCLSLPCNSPLAAVDTSARLPKKLLTPLRTKDGVTFLYPVATGFRMKRSALSLKLNTARLTGSNGSLIELTGGVVAQDDSTRHKIKLRDR